MLLSDAYRREASEEIGGRVESREGKISRTVYINSVILGRIGVQLR